MVDTVPINRSRRRVIVVAGLVITLFFVAGAGLWLWSLLARRTAEAPLAAGAQPSRIELDAGAGDVTVTRAEDNRVSVQRTLTWSSSRPELIETTEGDTLRLGAHCSGPSLVNRCYVTYHLRVPDSVAVNVRTGSGNVVVRDVKGQLKIASSSGDVRLGGLTGDADVTGGSGDVSIAYAAVPHLVRARTSSGDLRVVVPAGSYEIRAGGDDTTVDIPSTAGAPNVINVESRSGTVRVSRSGS
jgi:hypothetical protein